MLRSRVMLLRATLLLLTGMLFFYSIDWGLPSRASDRFLFGPTRTPWTGATILTLAGNTDDTTERGSDVADHAPLDRTRPVTVNRTDEDRARIVRRYRLYSNQPDEMITFRALGRMHPGRGDFDPRFFQYGGAWVYPVGVLLKTASLIGRLRLSADAGFYLDHPAAFGRFYVIARLYSAVWGLIGSLLMFELARLWSGKVWAGTFAGLLYALMPVAINAAHEAKPHLAGSVLVLATLWAATNYLDRGRRRWALAAALLAGGAASMVWTGAAAFAALPTMFALRRPEPGSAFRPSVAAVAIALLAFALLNPYLPIDLLLHRQVVFSNVGNSTAMYQARLTVAGAVGAGRLMGDAMNPVVAAAALLSVAALALRRRFARHPAWLAIGPAVLVGLQFVLLATAKPAEYARFSLTLDLLLVIALAVVCANLRSRAVRNTVAVVLLILMAGSASSYLRHFRDDRPGSSSRARAAALIAMPSGPVFIHAEPAPYCVPPVNLFDRNIVLLPMDVGTSRIGVDVIAVDRRPSDGWIEQCTSIFGWSNDAPITWADKPFAIHTGD